MRDIEQVKETSLEEIDIRELLAVVWDGKWKIVVITLVFAIGSVINALEESDRYTASVLLAPAQSGSSGANIGGALSQLGGLASLAGVTVGDRASDAEIAKHIMVSWDFVEQFIEDNDLAIPLAAASSWEKPTNSLMLDPGIYDSTTNKWLSNDGPPTSWVLFQKFSGMLSISDESGLLRVSIDFYSPEIAKRWLDLYVEQINKHMQSRQLEAVTRNIAYLERQIEQTAISEMKDVFYTIIEEQTKNKMLAEATPEYAFVSVSPSMVPEMKSGPNRALMCVMGTAAGGIISIILVLLLHYVGRQGGPGWLGR